MSASREPGPTLPEPLLLRVLHKLELAARPRPDLAGLNAMQAAYATHVPNDNVRKRIWLAGDRSQPIAGGDPRDFLEHWLEHGTGGTCFPSNGALCTLLCTLGFAARRITGGVQMAGIEADRNHGSVLVSIDGVDYLVDAQLAALGALQLIPGTAASTGDDIHSIRAVPTADGLDVHWRPGANRQSTLVMRPDLHRGPVDHEEFLDLYALSASSERRRSPFNSALFAGRHFADRIVIVSRNIRTEVLADNSVTRREVGEQERFRVLVNELGLSEAIVRALPPDEDEAAR